VVVVTIGVVVVVEGTVEVVVTANVLVVVGAGVSGFFNRKIIPMNKRSNTTKIKGDCCPLTISLI